MSVYDRLTELGLALPEVPTPAGMYVPALVHESLVYTSGQLPMVDGHLLATGVVGDDVSMETAVACARVCALNAVAAAAHAAGGLDKLARIIKVTGYVASSPEFTAQPTVVNGASALLGDIFADAGVHVRAAVGVASLPLGAPVEVELVAALA